MNADELDAIESRINASTPAPWQKTWEHDDDEDGYAVTGGAEPGTMHEHLVAYTLDWPASEEQAAADAEFIAHAREDVPALIAEVRRLRGRATTIRSLADGRLPNYKEDDYDAGYIHGVHEAADLFAKEDVS